METSVISPNKSQDRIWKSTRKGRCYEWLCKILIHDSLHRFLYPILSKRSPSVSTLGTNVNRVNVTTENAIRSRISTLTFFDRIGHVSWKRNTKRNATRLTGIENRKINSDCESIIVCQWKFSFYHVRRRYEYPFSSNYGSISAVCHYIHGARVTNRERD